MHTTDWSGSPSSEPAPWPQSLRTTIETMLASGQGMMLAWGAELRIVYHDAYAPFLGLRHPGTLGRPFREVWSDIWTDIAPRVDWAMSGEAVWLDDFHLEMERNGYKEDTWWQFSYSPVRAIEPFFSTKGIGKGTGLGLSMVHGLVAQLGGKLMIESTPGRGTAMALWLPVSLQPVSVEQVPKTRGIALLVDDEELVRMTTAAC